MKISIILNGIIDDFEFYKQILNKSDIVICADGGVNVFPDLDYVPDYVIGDLDSAEENILEKLKKQGTKIIYDPDQDKTDFELAINLANELNPEEVVVLGALGGRFDHALANVYCLEKFDENIKVKIIDSKHEIQLVVDSIEIKGEIGDVVSILPLTEISGLSYEGLKWNVKNRDTDFGWLGICNRFTSKQAKISFKKGKILVIKILNNE